MHQPQQKSAGFTRLEFVAVIAGLGLLALVAIPALATSVSDSHRAVCANNLRQLGGALLGWAGDHGGAVPWRVPIHLGGTQYTPKAGNAWFEFSALSNHISPRVITCPADLAGDLRVLVSRDWPTLFGTNRDNSVSYQLNLDIGLGGEEEAEVALLDRNMRYDYDGGGCSSGVSNPKVIRAVSPESLLQWTNAVHGLNGHVLMMDGTVENTTTSRLRALVLKGVDGAYREYSHFMKAR